MANFSSRKLGETNQKKIYFAEHRRRLSPSRLMGTSYSKN